MNRVRKNKKEITKLRMKMIEEGPMTFPEIKDWMNDRLRNGVTSNRLGNQLSKSGYFEKVGETRVASIMGGSHIVTIWNAKVIE